MRSFSSALHSTLWIHRHMPTVTSELIEQLLFEEEGVALDFKSAQYEFVGASEEAKAELLKDILAFANSWRRVDAYILVGVREAKGARSQVVGLASHIDDAQLQQFVNAKVQRPMQLSYKAMQLDGKDIAVIHIPIQERPFYLQRDYGHLKADVVYIRRGSATDVARPDEVARMGKLDHDARDIVLDVFFADPKKRVAVQPQIRSLVLEVPKSSEIPDHRSTSDASYMVPSFRHANAEYFRELVQFTRVDRLLSPVHFAISNAGSTPAQDVRLEISVAGVADGIKVLDADEFPSVPQETFELINPVSLGRLRRRIDMTAREVGDRWLIEGVTTKVQPRATVWFEDPIYIGALKPGQCELHVTVFADNLTQPHTQTLTLTIDSEREVADLSRIITLEAERFQNSEGHRTFLREHGMSEEGEAS